MKLGNYVCKYLGIVISWCLYRDLEWSPLLECRYQHSGGSGLVALRHHVLHPIISGYEIVETHSGVVCNGFYTWVNVE